MNSEPELAVRVAKAAERDGRTVSNWLNYVVVRAIEASEQKQAMAAPPVVDLIRQPVQGAIERTFILNEETGDTKGVEITARASTVAPPAPTRYKRSVQKKERTA